jgi:hypothetical protein
MIRSRIKQPGALPGFFLLAVTIRVYRRHNTRIAVALARRAMQSRRHRRKMLRSSTADDFATDETFTALQKKPLQRGIKIDSHV